MDKSVNPEWLMEALLGGDARDQQVLGKYATRITAAAQDMHHGEIACSLEGVCVRPQVDASDAQGYTTSKHVPHQRHIRDPHPFQLGQSDAHWNMLHGFIARYRTQDIPGTGGTTLSPRTLRTALYAAAMRFKEHPALEPTQLHDAALHICQALVHVVRGTEPGKECAWAVSYVTKARHVVKHTAPKIRSYTSHGESGGAGAGLDNGLDVQGYDEEEEATPRLKAAKRLQEAFWRDTTAPRTVAKLMAWLLRRVSGAGGEWSFSHARASFMSLGVSLDTLGSCEGKCVCWRDWVTEWYISLRSSHTEVTEEQVVACLQLMPVNVLSS